MHPKAYRIVARLKNNRLWAEIQRTFPRVRSQSEAARFLRVSPSSLGLLLNMRVWPYSERRGCWCRDAQRIARRLRNIPEYLFDRELYGRPPAPVAIEVDRPALEAAGLLALPPATPEEVVLEEERRGQLEEALRGLVPREAEVLRLRFGLDGGIEHTLAAVAQEFAVGKERIRQIEAKALRKLGRRFTAMDCDGPGLPQ